MRKKIEDSWPASKVEIWPLDRIVPYDRNPRTHPPAQIEILAASMRDDGVTSPILVDENGVIIYGHGRRLAAISNGYKNYPVIIARGWSEEKKQAVRIKDNSIALLAGWDGELMKVEIGALKTAGYDISLLAFPEAQLRGFGILVGTEGQADPDAVPEMPKKPVTRLGDLWLLGAHVTCPKCGKDTKLENAVRRK